MMNFLFLLFDKTDRTNEKLTIRRCVLENMDTQCGEFRLWDENERFKGCILTCDTDVRCQPSLCPNVFISNINI